MNEFTLKKLLKLRRQAKRFAEPFQEVPEPDSFVGRMVNRELERRAGWKYRFGQWIRKTIKKDQQPDG